MDMTRIGSTVVISELLRRPFADSVLRRNCLILIGGQKQDLTFIQGVDDLIYYRNTLYQALCEKFDGRPTH